MIGYMFRHLQDHHQAFQLNQVIKHCVYYWDPITVYKQ